MIANSDIPNHLEICVLKYLSHRNLLIVDCVIPVHLTTTDIIATCYLLLWLMHIMLAIVVEAYSTCYGG